MTETKEISIKAAANGFIVAPVVPPSNHPSPDEVFVFESYEALFEQIERHFGPLIDSRTKSPND